MENTGYFKLQEKINDLKVNAFNDSVSILCESYKIREQINPNTKVVEAVFLEGIAITFGKPTRNRVSYKSESGIKTANTLIGKPFLDTHNDSSIRTHPPFGHVVNCFEGINPKNKLKCLNYRVSIDPEEKVFIRKAKRGDISGCSIQVLVDNVTEKQDNYGSYIEANIREYLELSAVLIPGDGDTTIKIAEKFGLVKKEDFLTANGEGLIAPDGVVSKKKVMKSDEPEMGYSANEDMETPEEKEKKKPVQPLPPEISLGIKEGEKEKIFSPKAPNVSGKKLVKFKGTRNTECAYRGCNCPQCGMQMLQDRYRNKIQLRCWACDYRI